MSRASRRMKSNTVMMVLAMVMFIMGIVVGMLIVSLYNRNDKKKITNTVTTVSQPNVTVVSNGPEVTNVYIPARERVFGQIPVNSYIAENFIIEDGFMAYYDENGDKISHLGVDISYHQKSVDWEKLKNAGVEFVMLRCGYRGYTEGGLVEDEKFREYAKACNEAGIDLGVYFFTQAVSIEEARKEAEFVIDLIKDYDISYPVAFDTEFVSDSGARTNVEEIDEALRSQMCVAFCETISEAGYYPMIYASENWIRRELEYEALQEYDFWAPQYLDENDFMYDFTIWQYTESGHVPGISEEVDINISMVDYAKFVPKLREAVLTGGDIVTASGNVLGVKPVEAEDEQLSDDRITRTVEW